MARPFSRGVELPDVPGSRPLTCSGRGLSMRLADSDRGTLLALQWREQDGSASALDVLVERPAGHESLSVVIPWSDDRFQFTTKDQARPVRGVLRRHGAELAIGATEPAWGVLDVGRGRWPYSVTWNWGGGAGRATTGEVVGLQFGGRWTEGTGFTENAITVDGRLHKIGRELEWTYDWNHPMRPWRVRDRGGALDLLLTPRLDRHDATDAVVLRTEVHQVFGNWSGTVTDERGRELDIEDAQGFAEESRSRW